eukprot:1190518-Lingulodinium_polyedra.AAC.1
MRKAKPNRGLENRLQDTLRKLVKHHSEQGKPIEPNGKPNRPNRAGRFMAKLWPVHGQCMANSWPVRGQFMGNS